MWGGGEQRAEGREARGRNELNGEQVASCSVESPIMKGRGITGQNVPL